MSILDVPGISKAQLEKRLVAVTADNISARDSAQAFSIDALSAVLESHSIVLKAPLEAAAVTEDLQTKLAKGEYDLGYLSPLRGAIRTALTKKLSYTINTEEFGAIADGQVHPISERFNSLAEAQALFPFVTSLNHSSDWVAGQAALYAAETFPCRIEWKPGTHVLTDSYIWCGNAGMQGHVGQTVWKLAAGANCTVLKSRDFDKWVAFTAGQSNLGYTMDGWLDGIIIDGNASEQGDVSSTLANLIYGIQIHSHRFSIGWLQVRRVKGVGIRTKYNSTLMYSFRTDGVDDFGMQGDPRGSPSPYDFKSINVIDCLYEAFVFEGPADIPIWHLTTNYCGWFASSDAPTTPRTSLLYPGEEIHSIRIQTACKIGYMNSNGALYGRSLYVAPFTRFHCDTAIVTGSWGACLIEGSAFGSIGALSIQQNTFAWGGVFKPGLEISPGTGSAVDKCRFSFPQVSLRRKTTPDTPNAIGPGIVDRAGAQFGIIDGIDSVAQAGHGLVIASTNRGGIYESVNFDSIQGISHDGSESAAVLIESGSYDWRITELRLTNCNRSLANLGTNMRGIVRSGLIWVNKAADVNNQVAMEGVVTESQLASVTPGTGTISIDNIASWGVEIIDKAARYYNRFKATVTFVGGTAGSQILANVPHTMWRRPGTRDFKTGILFGGTTWPNITLGVKDIQAGFFIPAAFVHTAATGNVSVTYEFQ